MRLPSCLSLFPNLSFSKTVLHVFCVQSHHGFSALLVFGHCRFQGLFCLQLQIAGQSCSKLTFFGQKGSEIQANQKIEWGSRMRTDRVGSPALLEEIRPRSGSGHGAAQRPQSPTPRDHCPPPKSHRHFPHGWNQQGTHRSPTWTENPLQAQGWPGLQPSQSITLMVATWSETKTPTTCFPTSIKTSL